LLKREVAENDIILLADKFASLVKEKVIASAFIDGAYEFIKKNASKQQFICTGTPEFEILEIAERKGISHFFQHLYGSPKTKSEIIDMILIQTSVNKENCIFFGDAMTDYNASKNCNIPFIGIKNADTKFPEGTSLIEDFNDPLIKTML
jgi:HAD superfamily hydrolase (TIGR01549 family)